MHSAVVDMCAFPRLRSYWKGFLTRLGAGAPLYLRILSRGLARYFGVSRDEYRSRLRDTTSLIEWLTDPLPDDSVADGLAGPEFAHHVVHGLPQRDGLDLNTWLACSYAQRSDVSVWAAVELSDPNAALAVVRGARDSGFSGISVTPFLEAYSPTDGRSMEVLGAAAEEGLPVWLHVGQNFNPDFSLSACTWQHVDRIAATLPNMTLIVGHGGYPWIGELVAVIQRHANVHLELSAHMPGEAVKFPGWGWDPLVAHSNGILSRRVLYGSCAWAAGITRDESLRSFVGLPVGTDTMNLWLGDNARRILSLPA